MLPFVEVDLTHAANIKVAAVDDAAEANRSSTPATSRWGYSVAVTAGGVGSGGYGACGGMGEGEQLCDDDLWVWDRRRANALDPSTLVLGDEDTRWRRRLWALDLEVMALVVAGEGDQPCDDDLWVWDR
ncbi:hypothetical protein E2562_001037 [Oryza meyeriana var. granulata]|uniref:Uncharacterized protein n=1 Tax=Oryza meyeriana var. granulata TaxID=110450 RepID=A0A6G1ECW7_9ORYZ|nr:hypothetical protein E2562_001037 [Oryza meyeriana var. granulata]